MGVSCLNQRIQLFRLVA